MSSAGLPNPRQCHISVPVACPLLWSPPFWQTQPLGTLAHSYTRTHSCPFTVHQTVPAYVPVLSWQDYFSAIEQPHKIYEWPWLRDQKFQYQARVLGYGPPETWGRSTGWNEGYKRAAFDEVRTCQSPRLLETSAKLEKRNNFGPTRRHRTRTLRSPLLFPLFPRRQQERPGGGARPIARAVLRTRH